MRDGRTAVCPWCHARFASIFSFRAEVREFIASERVYYQFHLIVRPSSEKPLEISIFDPHLDRAYAPEHSAALRLLAPRNPAQSASYPHEQNLKQLLQTIK